MTVNSAFSGGLSRAALLSLGISSAIGYASLFMLLPAIPHISATFQTSAHITQLAVSLGFLLTGIGQLGFGLLADRYSRRSILLYSMLLFTVASLLVASSPSIELLIIGRVLQAFSGSAGITLARAFAMDSGSRDQAAAAMGYIFLPVTLVPLVSVPLSGLLTDLLGWRWVFFATSVLGALGFLLVITYVPSTEQAGRASKRFWLDIRTLWRSQRYRGYCGHHSLVVVALQVVSVSAPIIVVSQLNYSATQYGIFAAVPALGSILGVLAGGKFAMSWGGDRLIGYGSLLAITSYALILVAVIMASLSPWSIFLPMTVIAFSNALILPSSSAGALEGRANLMGTGAGLMGMIQWFLAGIAAQVAAFWVESSLLAVFLLSFFCYWAALFSFWIAGSSK